jgi:hypothetical protein
MMMFRICTSYLMVVRVTYVLDGTLKNMGGNGKIMHSLIFILPHRLKYMDLRHVHLYYY